MAFGGGMGESLFGSHIGNVLTKTTIILGIVFLVNTTILAMLGTKSNSVIKSVTDSIPVAAPAPTPAPLVPQTPAQLPMSTEKLPAVNVKESTTPAKAVTVEVPSKATVEVPKDTATK